MLQSPDQTLARSCRGPYRETILMLIQLNGRVHPLAEEASGTNDQKDAKVNELEERLGECRKFVAPNSRGLPKRLKELKHNHHTLFMETYNCAKLSVARS
jgi:hypothetical protein